MGANDAQVYAGASVSGGSEALLCAGYRKLSQSPWRPDNVSSSSQAPGANNDRMGALSEGAAGPEARDDAGAASKAEATAPRGAISGQRGADPQSRLSTRHFHDELSGVTQQHYTASTRRAPARRKQRAHRESGFSREDHARMIDRLKADSMRRSRASSEACRTSLWAQREAPASTPKSSSVSSRRAANDHGSLGRARARMCPRRFRQPQVKAGTLRVLAIAAREGAGARGNGRRWRSRATQRRRRRVARHVRPERISPAHVAFWEARSRKPSKAATERISHENDLSSQFLRSRGLEILEGEYATTKAVSRIGFVEVGCASAH